ncbi:MAG: peptide-methionine (S)-S-oxide reductase MsrA [Bacteroidota bacterium]
MRHTAFFFTLAFSLFLLNACSASHSEASHSSSPSDNNSHQTATPVSLEGQSKAYFASGCFWCVEAIFESVEGVSEAISGYSGGQIKDPTYRLVSSGRTQHAEAVEVYYDPEVVSFETLVKVFFGSHDPTTPNQQGPDRGPQYRSIAFYQTAEEKAIIETYIQTLKASGEFKAEIVTEVLPFDVFYDAEPEHQNFERLNPNNQYVRYVSIPRLKKFQAKFPELLKAQGH